jgi:hypothetical protein
MNKFIIKLSYETWGSVFDNSDVDPVFSFNTYLRILYSGFPIQN